MHHSPLYQKIFEFENLLTAFHAAKKGKRYQAAVLSFERNLEENLINLQNHLIWHSWQPGAASHFTVTDPKMRQITAPPFADRVIHHAMHQVIEPYFERRFIYDSYACRTGKGVHAASNRLQYFLRCAKRNFGDKFYVVKVDIKSYFASINHHIMLDQFGKTITDSDVQWLYQQCISAYGFSEGVGLPVGALTSQLSANIMLDALDHVIKDAWGEKYYLRYMDDFVVLVKNKQRAQDMMFRITEEANNLKLTINQKSCYFPWQRGVDFCGYRSWPTHTLPRKRTVKRAKKRIKKAVKLSMSGRASHNDVKSHVASFQSYMKRCSGNRTLESIIGDAVFGQLCNSAINEN